MKLIMIEAAVVAVLLCAVALNGQTMETKVKETSAVEVLTLQEQGLVRMASCTARGDIAGLEFAADAALDAGVTLGEAKEALSQLYAYCGFPRSLNALSALQRVADARARRGIIDSEGEAPFEFADSGVLAKGTANQTKLCGREIGGGLYDFVPQIDYYLKAHLFGDVFGRETLDWRTREIVTVAALSSMEGVEAQCNAHIGIAKHNGVSDDAIRAIITIAKGYFPQMFPKGEPNDKYAQYFTGQSYLALLTQDTALHCPVSNVTFEPGCRNNWHSHTGGQLLIVTAGEGWYQERGKAARRLRAGDVVEIPCGVEHWHGATVNSWFSHLAITTNVQTNQTTWLEAVSEAEYRSLDD
ncbi:MAG: carboxymuconolactone decarboxylase family protein [Paludibacter sp.]|nr:carboxymuconolactone decarboxylase family protein [Bacteroidales bacterium]MCM1069704.1 carboxymuconolactone decarboxylase family protein [Prevotella sp.]MCM1354388.1 carboxymuconolactone decarboxylase family protein [Bacteroides sp.]MCM1441935.1 carboxymuconolactone decarboxylase family protein [Muribaculum sp.]MCM1482586.1 carboxymuconolactone decarboxylase family protein [Paludibacter sp.]